MYTYYIDESPKRVCVLMQKSSKIALLATGDEIVNGDISNSNGQRIAQILSDLGLQVGQQLAVCDNQCEIADALRYLLSQHAAVIVIGGLGPTSDDRTRFALSDVIEQELVPHEACWQRIEARLTHLGVLVHEANRQQTLFPENSVILPNQHGTADGCQINFKQHLIFLLPGPPKECLTLFEEQVLPILQDHYQHRLPIEKKWRLFGVSEGDIAAQIDKALEAFECRAGYRVDYPYLEIKVRPASDCKADTLFAAIEAVIQPYLLSHTRFPASQVLKSSLEDLSELLIIDDQATGGELQTRLQTPTTHQIVQFSSLDLNKLTNLAISIRGLDELWRGEPTSGNTNIHLEFYYQSQIISVNKTLPYRHHGVVKYAVEYVADQILQFLTKQELLEDKKPK